MNGITLIGLGLYDEKDLTLRGLEEIKESDVVYLENYTSSLINADKEDLEKKTGKKIQYADRSFVEEGKILNYAKSNKVALLVPGDPFIATTHSDLIIRARKAGIKTETVHNASIYSSIAETGLQIYKFGKTTTITFWEPNYKPKSFYNVIKQNKERELHTMLLLDIEKEENRYLTAGEAIRTLLKIEEEEKQEVFTEDTKTVLVSQLGSPKREIRYGKAKKIMKTNLPPLHTLVVPGDLHEREERYLEQYKVD